VAQADSRVQQEVGSNSTENFSPMERLRGQFQAISPIDTLIEFVKEIS
jgi:hypothetical protein